MLYKSKLLWTILVFSLVFCLAACADESDFDEPLEQIDSAGFVTQFDEYVVAQMEIASTQKSMTAMLIATLVVTDDFLADAPQFLLDLVSE